MKDCEEQDQTLLRKKHLYLHPIKHLLKDKYIRLYGNLASFALIYNKEDLLVQFLSCDRNGSKLKLSFLAFHFDLEKDLGSR